MAFVSTTIYPSITDCHALELSDCEINRLSLWCKGGHGNRGGPHVLTDVSCLSDCFNATESENEFCAECTRAALVYMACSLSQLCVEWTFVTCSVGHSEIIDCVCTYKLDLPVVETL